MPVVLCVLVDNGTGYTLVVSCRPPLSFDPALSLLDAPSPQHKHYNFMHRDLDDEVRSFAFPDPHLAYTAVYLDKVWLLLHGWHHRTPALENSQRASLWNTPCHATQREAVMSMDILHGKIDPSESASQEYMDVTLSLRRQIAWAAARGDTTDMYQRLHVLAKVGGRC